MDHPDRPTVHPSTETPPFADPLPDASALPPADRSDPSVAPPELVVAGRPRRPSGTPLPSSIPTPDPELPEGEQVLHAERSSPSR